MSNFVYEEQICTNCGGKVEKTNDGIACKICGSVFFKKQLDSKVFINLENAEIERQSANFSIARNILLKTINEYPNEDLSDIYWNLVLCNQNIIFETDGKGNRFPSFYNVSETNILQSEEYHKAMEYASSFNNGKDEVYNKLAMQIEMSKIMYKDIKEKTKPYDIFICFKKSDENGNTTRDTQLALDIYNELSNEYKIFFSEKSLANIKSVYREYEPNIYYGLYTAKVMLLICSKKEYLESTWLKNEWDRFTKINKQNSTSSIIPIFMNGFNPSDLPENLWHIQGIKEDIKLISNLKEQLESIIHPINEFEELKRQQEELLQKQQEENERRILEIKKSLMESSNSKSEQKSDNKVDSLLRRAEIFLEDEDYVSADNYADRILDIDPEYSKAYILKLLSKSKVKNINVCREKLIKIDETKEFKNALRFADLEYKNELENLVKDINNKIMEKKNEQIYTIAFGLINKNEFNQAITEFNKILNYKDSKDKIEYCKETKNLTIYNQAINFMNDGNFSFAISKFSEVIGYKDSLQKIEECRRLEQEKNDNIIYDKANNYFVNKRYENAIKEFEKILLFKDSSEKIELSKQGIYEKGLHYLKNNSFDNAINIFESLKDFSDSRVKIEECKEIKKNYNREKVYKQALDRLNLKKLSANIFNQSIEDFKSIKEYKDANEQYFRAKEKFEAWKKAKRRNKILIISLASLALIITCTIMMINLVIIPSNNYKKAQEHFINCEYDEAYNIYDSLGDYKDCSQKKQAVLASKKLANTSSTLNDADLVIKDLLTNDINVCVYYRNKSQSVISTKRYESLSSYNGFRDVYAFVDKSDEFEYFWNFEGFRYTVKETNPVFIINLIMNSETKYTLTYELDGGYLLGENPSKCYQSILPITLNNPKKLGYNFIGWTNELVSEPTKNFVITTENVKDDLNFVAHYEIITYTITYKLNGGTNNSLNKTTFTVEDLTLTLHNPTKEDNYFVGWYLESDFWTKISQIDTNYLKNFTLYARWTDTPLYTRSEDTIIFGSYPQTKITDNDLIDTLNTKSGTLPTAQNSQLWTDYGYYISGSVSSYMWYIDLEYNTNKYRGVYFTSYRPWRTTYSSSSSNTYQDDKGYTISTVYWFKYEPITWTVIEEVNGYATIVCDMILDSHDFYYNDDSKIISGETIYSNNYEYSHIRAWLNDTFYNTAFNSLEQALIQITTVDNSVSSTGNSSNSYACNNTNDKIYLLSYKEANTYLTTNSVRQKIGTDYAKCQGLCFNANGYGYWWIRSPYGYKNSSALIIGYDGSVNYGEFVYNTYYGVVPALKLKL